MSDLTLKLFTGKAGDPETAVKLAEREACSYLRPRQWHTTDGRSAYQVTVSLHPQDVWYLCIVAVLGPDALRR